MLTRVLTALATSVGALAATTLLASAQNFPTRPMTMIIPFAAGGPQDQIGRVMGQRMGEILGQQFVIQNISGAGGTVIRVVAVWQPRSTL